jgi:hypothetical protein
MCPKASRSVAHRSDITAATHPSVTIRSRSACPEASVAVCQLSGVREVLDLLDPIGAKEPQFLFAVCQIQHFDGGAQPLSFKPPQHVGSMTHGRAFASNSPP